MGSTLMVKELNNMMWIVIWSFSFISWRFCLPPNSNLSARSSWVRWKWTDRLSRSVSRSTVHCSLKLWTMRWTVWRPWTPCLCQDASVWEATVMWGPLTKGVLGRKKEKEGDPCCCYHPHHHAHLQRLSGPSRAAQVGERSLWKVFCE